MLWTPLRYIFETMVDCQLGWINETFMSLTLCTFGLNCFGLIVVIQAWIYIKGRGGSAR